MEWSREDQKELLRLAGLAASPRVKVFLDAQARTAPASAPPPSAPAPATVVSSSAPPASSGLMWTTIQNLACDFGGYSGAKVTVYIDEGLEGVGAIPRANVTCDFTSDSFDLKVVGLNGRNYRVVKRNLEKDIDPTASTLKVRKNKVILKLAKVEGEYGYESWTRLTSTKSKEKKRAAKKDPSASIMDMMKDMYDGGDDQTKKLIGEAMMKSREGKQARGSGGGGGLGDDIDFGAGAGGF